MKKKSKFVSKFKENDRESVIIESVFINFKHTVVIGARGGAVG